MAFAVTVFQLTHNMETHQRLLELKISLPHACFYLQDVRSPDVIELFNPGSATIGSQLFPASTASPRYQVGGLNFANGNDNLQPEIAHTTTGGIVLSPTAIEGLQTSLDFYKINVAHSTQPLRPQRALEG